MELLSFVFLQYHKQALIITLQTVDIFVKKFNKNIMQKATKVLTAFQRNFTWFMTSMFIS